MTDITIPESVARLALDAIRNDPRRSPYGHHQHLRDEAVNTLANALAAAYPNGYGRCIMCGAARNAPCTVISGSGVPGDQPGDSRPDSHGGRPMIGSHLEPPEVFTPVKDEGAYH